MRVQNASFSSSAGGLGSGDRGAWNSIPNYTGNPYDSTDFVYRWRQYVHLYETSWEARKIVRIIPEDALRKEWVVEGIDQDMARKIKARLDQLQFMQTLKRSLILERLLGGCLTFLGIESTEDNTEKAYHPKEGSRLAFCNAIPISRVSRLSWNTDPLDENYMRPQLFMVNGQEVHVSRCLVWDGEPLYDPYDFALTNFRANISGFGPSKLAPIWDDIVKAVGTRQAAYQMIQTNNAILMMINDLQDLGGTAPGKKHLEKLKEVANSLSVYRAALIDGDKVDVKQHSASFGSVPELIITFIQILSAASDIPATRFLGQAPGGLNASGESDLENYYNVIDAFQRQRIEPQLRRMYDIIGFNLFKDQWKSERDKLEFVFPPLWNASELEEADKHTKQIDNAMKLFDAGMMSEAKVIEEMNAKKVFSVELDETDISIVDEGLGMLGGPEESPAEQGGSKADAKAELQKLKNVAFGGWRVGEGGKIIQNSIDFDALIRKAGNADVDMNQFQKGWATENEHRASVSSDKEPNDDLQIARIVLDHLNEDPEYYDKLEKVENTAEQEEGRRAARAGKQVTDNPYPANDRRKRQWSDSFVSERARMKRGDAVHWTIENSPTFPQRGETSPLSLHGLSLAIENPKGSLRTGVNHDGTPWTSILPAAYGHIKKTVGADGDEVDVYIGPVPESELVFIVDQKNEITGEFDEHKCIFGALSLTQARELYLSGFGDGRGEERLSKITPLHVEDFKGWLVTGDTKTPFGGVK
jgi:phage-related protein (TIGR01555 family)